MGDIEGISDTKAVKNTGSIMHGSNIVTLERDIQVWRAIVEFMKDNNSLSPQVRDLTEKVINNETGKPVSTSTISSSYKRLVKAGLIEIRQKEGRFAPSSIVIVDSTFNVTITEEEAIEKITEYHERDRI